VQFGWARATKARLGSIPGRVVPKTKKRYLRVVQPCARRRTVHALCYHCIHCESSRVAYGASKRRWAPQTTPDTPKWGQKRVQTKLNWTILGCVFGFCALAVHTSEKKKNSATINVFFLVFFYNFGWKDYGVTSLHTVLDMVKVMCFALEEGRVAVHCHAGLGRTGIEVKF